MFRFNFHIHVILYMCVQYSTMENFCLDLIFVNMSIYEKIHTKKTSPTIAKIIQRIKTNSYQKSKGCRDGCL